MSTDTILGAILVKLCEMTDRLVEIRDVLTQGLREAEAEAVAMCQHPEEKRVDLSTFGDVNHWVCGVCRFDSKTQAMN